MDDLATLAARFAALGHGARLAVVRQLLAAHPAGQVVGELQQALGIPGSTLSHHLDALHQEGLVSKAREGRFLRYRADSEVLGGLLDFLYAECCQGPAAVPAPDRLVALGAPKAKGTGAPAGRLAVDPASGKEPPSPEGVPGDGGGWRAW